MTFARIPAAASVFPDANTLVYGFQERSHWQAPAQ